MPKAEGKIFKFDGADKIRPDFLEAIAYKGSKQLVRYTTREFSAVCPFSGLPDFGAVIIEYIPAGLLVELKSLKYYLVSFRNIGIYQEAATDRIFKDIWRLLKPRYLMVKTEYNTRGGIDAVCTIEKGSR
ncbi:MAG: preQ(1) synthase [Planctomycetota bacterium]